jgi:hypothetical protein
MFRIRWEERALRELTELWIQSDSERRKAITGAAQRIDDKLRRHAADAGESRDNRQRILFAEPLIITFRVEEDEITASVLTVGETRHRRR